MGFPANFLMSLKEAIIKKIDELILKGEEVYVPSCRTLGFGIGEIRTFRLIAPWTTRVFVEVLGAQIPLDTQDATAIYDYLESCYHERLDKEANRKREAALKYLEVS